MKGCTQHYTWGLKRQKGTEPWDISSSNDGGTGRSGKYWVSWPKLLELKDRSWPKLLELKDSGTDEGSSSSFKLEFEWASCAAAGLLSGRISLLWAGLLSIASEGLGLVDRIVTEALEVPDFLAARLPIADGRRMQWTTRIEEWSGVVYQGAGLCFIIVPTPISCKYMLMYCVLSNVPVYMKAWQKCAKAA